MEDKTLGIDNRAILGQLFKAAFGVAPVYITVPLGSAKPARIEGISAETSPELINEDEVLKSVYDTPIIYPVKFVGGDYAIYNKYGKPTTRKYQDLWLPATTMTDFQRSKNIIKTNVLGSNGTVKEVFGFDDWNIRIRMLCLNDNRLTAKEYMNTLVAWFEIAESIEVVGSLFSKKEISRIVLEDFDVKTIPGSPDVIPIEFTATSDEPMLIFINKES